VKEHELRLVEVDGEARMGEPGVDVVPSPRDLGDGRKECGSGHRGKAPMIICASDR